MLALPEESGLKVLIRRNSPAHIAARTASHLRVEEARK